MLRGPDLMHLGLRLGLRVGPQLRLHGTVVVSQTNPIFGGSCQNYRYQSPLHTDQVETGVHFSQRSGHFMD